MSGLLPFILAIHADLTSVVQNTLQLLDRLDQANVRNYDVHVFPDSDHSIFFHGANQVVYESKYSPASGHCGSRVYVLMWLPELRDWLVNAFNGEWLKTSDPKPIMIDG